jgi:hypothetical protein
MIKFPVAADLEKILFSLGLEYQYLYTMGEKRSHRNRFCLLDGTVILEVSIQEETGNVQIRDKLGTREYPSLDLMQLDLRIVNLGGTLTPVIPYIYIRALYGRRVLHHSEYKNEGLGNIQEPSSSRTKLQANNIMIC